MESTVGCPAAIRLPRGLVWLRIATHADCDQSANLPMQPIAESGG